MPERLPSLKITGVEFRVHPTATRFPFRYGIASMTIAPHLFVRATLTVGGKKGQGLASEGLPPKWFTKNPETSFEDDLPEMFKVICRAADILKHQGPKESFFEMWRDLYREQHAWAEEVGVAPLLANLGISLMERAVLDGLCRVLETTCCDIVASNGLGLRLGEIYPELGNDSPCDYLPASPLRAISVRHTVGLGDPLIADEIEEPLDDGLPHALEESIREYGINHFKIKLSGTLEHDLDRLRRLRAVIESCCRGDYHFTLDGNEQYRDFASFRDHWEAYRSDSRIGAFFERLLFVEQPLHRQRALADEVRDALCDWPDAPPLIIDESEAELGCLPRALHLGYSGTSHKNCKGIVKGIANACFLEMQRRKSTRTRLILSGEDLGNIGPVALLQDLTMMAVLGIHDVERNGHHYFRGLSMFPPQVQSALLKAHPDLYRRHHQGFATLRIVNGKLDIGSLLDASFGVQPLVDTDAFDDLETWLEKHGNAPSDFAD